MLSHEATELLLEYGACPNTQDQLGNTPLHLACAKREACRECIYLLLKYHASSLILNNLSQSPSTILLNLKSTIVINKIQLNLMNEIFKKSNKSISSIYSAYNNTISINVNNTSINHHNHHNHQHSTSNHNHQPTNSNSNITNNNNNNNSTQNHIKASYNNGNNSLTNTLVSLNSIKNNINTKKSVSTLDMLGVSQSITKPAEIYRQHSASSEVQVTPLGIGAASTSINNNNNNNNNINSNSGTSSNSNKITIPLLNLSTSSNTNIDNLNAIISQSSTTKSNEKSGFLKKSLSSLSASNALKNSLNNSININNSNNNNNQTRNTSPNNTYLHQQSYELNNSNKSNRHSAININKAASTTTYNHQHNNFLSSLTSRYDSRPISIDADTLINNTNKHDTVSLVSSKLSLFKKVVSTSNIYTNY